MRAAIDVGSNTVRMLIARCVDRGIEPVVYRQQITRLAGGYTAADGLSRQGIERTLVALCDFAKILQEHEVEQVRVVGTAACRAAVNAGLLIKKLKLATRLELEIISGAVEARLSSRGMISVLDPLPATGLLIDIGGGSTEIIFCQHGEVLYSGSYPLGVVRLAEDLPDSASRQNHLRDMAVKIGSDLLRAGILPGLLSQCELVGTAGSMTTLAAIDLEMSAYNPVKINNHRLKADWLQRLLLQLTAMSVAEREEIPGLEPGRGDVIIPGLELVLALCRYFRRSSIRVTDAGLLEGLLLDSDPS